MPPTSPRILSGCRPGLLDPTQPQRLFRYSTSQISFASFNPLAATSQADLPDFRKLSLQEELYNAKRVVIEDQRFRRVLLAIRAPGSLGRGSVGRGERGLA